MIERKMPDRLHLGQFSQTPISMPMLNWSESRHRMLDGSKSVSRWVMGYRLPSWQRGVVWDETRQIRWIESVWLGLDLGTYAFNQMHDSPLDNLLIDGQQRLTALQRYLSDDFLVFGWHWSEVTLGEQRGFKNSRTFASYMTKTDDKVWLRDYYNRMNFGGVAHTESDRA